jgi:hypothetical protein
MTRHITFSFPDGSDPRRLKKIAREWAAAFAPRRPWVAVMHRDEKGRPHLHLMIGD